MYRPSVFSYLLSLISYHYPGNSVSKVWRGFCYVGNLEYLCAPNRILINQYKYNYGKRP